LCWPASEIQLHDVDIMTTVPVRFSGTVPALELATDALPGFEPGDTLQRFGPRGLKGNAWVLRNKTTGEPMMETSDPAKVRALNTAKYEAVPVGRHLADLNDKSTPASQWMRRGVAAQVPDSSTGRLAASMNAVIDKASVLSANDALAGVAEAPKRSRRARA
jgi:hypothetical protein